MTSTATTRPGMLICVVGESLSNPTVFDGTMCDYAIYPDLVKDGTDFVPLYGKTSWEAFKKATETNSQIGVGVSFSLLQAKHSNSTVAYIPTAVPQLEYFVRTMRVSAMGVLDFARREGMNTNQLKPMFEVLDRVVRQQNHKTPMVFLGVELGTGDVVDQFVSELPPSVGYITTIIIQTHVHDLPRGPPNGYNGCISFPVSLNGSPRMLPGFELARIAQHHLRSQGDNFRIMFSSTLGVAMFVGEEGGSEPTQPYQSCERTLLVDYDVLCNTTVSSGDPNYHRLDGYAYKTWVHGNRSYWASFETEQSLTVKLQRYITNVSDGWALFEVQHDVGKACGLNDNSRVFAVQTKARTRVP
ncbi:uncharacterized protein LOC144094747 [Amblyomma americanum]